MKHKKTIISRICIFLGIQNCQNRKFALAPGKESACDYIFDEFGDLVMVNRDWNKKGRQSK
ncbi:MAG: hypothetical protein WCW87_00360 [Candidatus Paceibacterota bacterium]